jgi:hypothetical protein
VTGCFFCNPVITLSPLVDILGDLGLVSGVRLGRRGGVEMRVQSKSSVRIAATLAHRRCDNGHLLVAWTVFRSYDEEA